MYRCKSCNSKNVNTTECHTMLCTDCGSERSCGFDITPLHVSYNGCHHQPFGEGYSRRKRFGTMLKNVIKGSCNLADEPMLIYLTRFKSEYTNMASLLSKIKKSKIRDKRYTSLHLFSRVFLPAYVKPRHPINWPAVEKSILNMFSEVEIVHRRLFSKPFFSYVWLLQKILVAHHLNGFCTFIKQLKCPKRIKQYEDDFAEIMAMLCQQDRFVGDRVYVSNFPKPPSERKGDRHRHRCHSPRRLSPS